MARLAFILAVLLVALGVSVITGGSGAAATACPASDPGQIVSQRPGASSSLVPDGASAVLVCEFNTIGYPGAGARNGLIGTGQSTDAATVTQLAAGLNALTEGSQQQVCPADAGDAYVAYFSYPSGVDDPVKVQLGGCDTTTNGLLTRLAIGSPVVGQITGLVHPAQPTGPTGGAGPKLPLGPGPVVISRISGRLLLCGGPAPGGCRVESFTVCEQGVGCTHDDRVRIRRDGSTVNTVRLHKGRFSVVVSPGRYTVQLIGDGPGKHVSVIQSRTVTARRYATAHVTFTIAVP